MASPDTVQISSDAGKTSFTAHICWPDSPPRAAVIVIQEIFGVNEGIRRKCAALAAAGYLALAPDLFWRVEPGVELDPDVEAEFKRAIALMGQFDQQQGVSDIAATISHARTLFDGGKVGVVGYCLGGRLAYMAATRTDVDASVGYYAVGVDGLLDEKQTIANRLMLHIAGDDGFVPPEAQQTMHAGLDDHPRVTLHDYPGLNHGFAAEMGTRRNEKAAQLADDRTLAFFAANLS